MKSRTLRPLNPTNIADKIAVISWPFFIGFSLLLLSLLGVTEWIGKPISYLFDPIVYYSSSAAQSIKNVGDTIANVSNLHKENNDLKIENAELLGENEMYELLYQENIALKKELELGDKSAEMIEGIVLSYDTAGYLTVNVGSESGVQKDDIVSFGNIYIGRVVQVLNNQSKIRLPSNSDSVLEVGVGRLFDLDSSVAELKSDYTQIAKKITHGIMEGTADGIKILNIPNKADVKVGDYIVVNDVKVGKLLIVGTVSDVNTDPTLPEKTIYLAPVINYEELTYLFIEKND